MKDVISINKNPTVKEFRAIEKWLQTEHRKQREGFFCNLEIIKESFDNKEVFTLTLNDITIGFAVWSGKKFKVKIDLFEIHPNYRKSGFGKFFYTQIEAEFKRRKFKVITLDCEPAESESFWIKMLFLKYPKTSYAVHTLMYYKPIIKIRELTNNQKNKNQIELWDVEPYLAKRNKPQWIWDINYKSGNKIFPPILHPCDNNWCISWTINEEIGLKKVKQFKISAKNNVEGQFLFITELIEQNIKETAQ